MIEINPPESTEFVLNPAFAKKPYFGLLASLAESQGANPLHLEWQDYNYFSGVLAYVKHSYMNRSQGYQILPKSLAVSLCRAYENDAPPEEALEVFGRVVWTVQEWSSYPKD